MPGAPCFYSRDYYFDYFCAISCNSHFEISNSLSNKIHCLFKTHTQMKNNVLRNNAIHIILKKSTKFNHKLLISHYPFALPETQVCENLKKGEVFTQCANKNPVLIFNQHLQMPGSRYSDDHYACQTHYLLLFSMLEFYALIMSRAIACLFYLSLLSLSTL